MFHPEKHVCLLFELNILYFRKYYDFIFNSDIHIVKTKELFIYNFSIVYCSVDKNEKIIDNIIVLTLK